MLRHVYQPGIYFTLAVALAVAALPGPSYALVQEGKSRGTSAEPAPGLVRVTLISDYLGVPETIVINDKVIPDYRPRIFQIFPSTGIVIDNDGHVLSFLGYRWVDVRSPNPRVEISTAEGEKLTGKLIGIDQSLGVAVVSSQTGKLKKTAICLKCEIRPDDTVVVPVFEKGGAVEFESARIVAIDTAGTVVGGRGWTVNFGRRMQGIGEPLLNGSRQVLGFIASPDIFYPVSQLLNSAEKVIKAGGNILTGWLGVTVDVEETQLRKGQGIVVKSVEKGSPAQKAGLQPEDLVRRWNGKEVREPREFIRSVQNAAIGSQASIEVERRGKELALMAVIEARRPGPVEEKFVLSFPEMVMLQSADVYNQSAQRPMSLYGIDTVALTPQLAEFFSIPVRSGLLVSNVDAQRAFNLAGVQVGDIIMAVDGRHFASPNDFYTHIRSRRPGSSIALKIHRKGAERTTIIILK